MLEHDAQSLVQTASTRRPAGTSIGHRPCGRLAKAELAPRAGVALQMAVGVVPSVLITQLIQWVKIDLRRDDLGA